MRFLRRGLFLFFFFAIPLVALADMVNVNAADAVTLAKNLKGVGATKAEAIVAYREANGPFLQVDDLLKVKGIGEKTLGDNRDVIVLE